MKNRLSFDAKLVWKAGFVSMQSRFRRSWFYVDTKQVLKKQVLHRQKACFGKDGFSSTQNRFRKSRFSIDSKLAWKSKFCVDAKYVLEKHVLHRYKTGVGKAGFASTQNRFRKSRLIIIQSRLGCKAATGKADFGSTKTRFWRSCLGVEAKRFRKTSLVLTQSIDENPFTKLVLHWWQTIFS